MLAPIFHKSNGEFWNINQILNQDENDDSVNEELMDLDPAEGPVTEDDIFDDNEENLSISECF